MPETLQSNKKNNADGHNYYTLHNKVSSAMARDDSWPAAVPSVVRRNRTFDILNREARIPIQVP